MEEKTYIYVIGRENGPVKVGVSSTPHSRVRMLQTGCPFPIAVLHVVACSSREEALRHEATVHAVYEENRLHGEWFDLDDEQALQGIETAIQTAEWMESEAADLAAV